METKILIFEDDPSFGLFLQKSLESKGSEVTLACNYNEAETILNNLNNHNCPNVAVLDIKQDVKGNLPDGVDPGKVGFFLADKIRQLSLPISIIFITSFPENYERQAAAYAPYAFLVKTVNNLDQEIFSKVKELENAGNIRLENLRRGRFCLSSSGTRYILKIDEILYFKGKDGQNTSIKILSKEKELIFGVTSGNLFNCLRDILSQQKLANPFFGPVSNYFVNFEKIVAYDAENVYFDHDKKLAIPVNGIQIVEKRYTRITTDPNNRIIW